MISDDGLFLLGFHVIWWDFIDVLARVTNVEIQENNARDTRGNHVFINASYGTRGFGTVEDHHEVSTE